VLGLSFAQFLLLSSPGFFPFPTSGGGVVGPLAISFGRIVTFLFSSRPLFDFFGESYPLLEQTLGTPAGPPA